jgi:archaeosine-15-forming tRNA-guanine transglycosylase
MISSFTVFGSKTAMNGAAGQPVFAATVNDVTDELIRDDKVVVTATDE